MLELTPHAVDKLATYEIEVGICSSGNNALDEGMDYLVDAETGAIFFRHPTLRGIPDLVVEGYGYMLEFIGTTLLWFDLREPTGKARLLADPVKAQLPIGV